MCVALRTFTPAAGAASLIALIASSGANAAPITFNTALPVSRGELIYRQQGVATRSADERGGVTREATEVMAITVLGYGIARKFAAFGALPVVYRRTGIGAAKSDHFGLGDASLFARYEVFRDDAPGATLRLAPFVGVTVPSGERGRTGDGSTDVFGGLIFTAAATEWSFDGQVQYTANNETKGFERGDAVNVDGSLQYRLFPGEISGDGQGFLFVVLEAGVAFRGEDRRFGAHDPNSGGVQVFVSPGLQYAAKRWIAEAAVRVPVVTDLDGMGLEPDYAVIAGMRFNF